MGDRHWKESISRLASGGLSLTGAVTHRGGGGGAVTHRGRAAAHRERSDVTHRGEGCHSKGRGLSITGERDVTHRGEGCHSQGRRLSLTGGGEVSLTGAVIHEVSSVELLVTTH